MKRIVAAFALALILAALPTVTSAQSAGVGARPANVDPDNPRTTSIFVKKLAAGERRDDAVKLINNTDDQKTMLLYATDSVISSGGAFACAQESDDRTNVGAWVQLEQTRAVLEPHSTLTVPFTLTAPASTEPGEHNGCIILQEEKDPSAQGGIALNFRTGIRVAVLIDGDIKKDITTQSLSVATPPGKVIVTPTIKNSGNVSVDTTVKTQLASVFRSVIDEKISTYPALRGEEASWNIEFDAPFWGGFYQAGYAIEYDKSANFLGETADSDIVSSTGPSRWIFVLPSLGAFLIYTAVLAAIAGAVYWLIRRNRDRTEFAQTWHNYEVKSGENLQLIAEAHGLPWKQLARRNQLKAPFTLSPGTTIKVPKQPHAPAKKKRKK
jgi:hypothetical protein